MIKLERKICLQNLKRDIDEMFTDYLDIVKNRFTCRGLTSKESVWNLFVKLPSGYSWSKRSLRYYFRNVLNRRTWRHSLKRDFNTLLRFWSECFRIFNRRSRFFLDVISKYGNIKISIYVLIFHAKLVACD